LSRNELVCEGGRGWAEEEEEELEEEELEEEE
jgi:hypothetical protein